MTWLVFPAGEHLDSTVLRHQLISAPAGGSVTSSTYNMILKEVRKLVTNLVSNTQAASVKMCSVTETVSSNNKQILYWSV